jgi:hypothetical protein
MNDPVTNFINQLTSPLFAPFRADLERVLRGPLDWRSADHRKAEALDAHVTNAVRVSHFWEAHQDGWHLVLTDFPVGDQPGHKPFDRGQNMVVSKPDSDCPILMSDGEVFHELAKWLLLRLRAAGLAEAMGIQDRFTGQGGVPRSRMIHLPPQKDSYTLDSVERLEQAITWLEQHIKNLGNAIWVFETKPVYYKFNQATKVATWWGETDEATNLVLKAMGWEIVHREPGSQN